MLKNICVKAVPGAYVVLFSRENKKPHTIRKSTELNSYDSFLEGCQRAVSLAKDSKMVFRPSDERILDAFNGGRLNEREKLFFDKIKEKGLTLEVKPALDFYETIMDNELNKKRC